MLQHDQNPRTAYFDLCAAADPLLSTKTRSIRPVKSFYAARKNASGNVRRGVVKSTCTLGILHRSVVVVPGLVEFSFSALIVEPSSRQSGQTAACFVAAWPYDRRADGPGRRYAHAISSSGHQRRARRTPRPDGLRTPAYGAEARGRRAAPRLPTSSRPARRRRAFAAAGRRVDTGGLKPMPAMGAGGTTRP